MIRIKVKMYLQIIVGVFLMVGSLIYDFQANFDIMLRLYGIYLFLGIIGGIIVNPIRWIALALLMMAHSNKKKLG